MNPGVVQWMAIKLLKDTSDPPLACYIFEHDSSFYKDKNLVDSKAIYTTWSVECFLDEAILSYPMFVRNQMPLYMYDHVYATEYKITLRDREFYGCLMPHEEVLSLGKLFDFELGFIYRVNLDTVPLGAYYVDELLTKTESNYGKYLAYYMRDFVFGENTSSYGLLHERIKRIK